MLRATWWRGRRGALLGASATVVCLVGIPAACAGGPADGGFVAVGPAGGTPVVSGAAVAPTGDVTLVPLEAAENRQERGRRHPPAEAGASVAPQPSPAATRAPEDTPDSTAPASRTPDSPPAKAGSPTPAATATPATPGGPAALSVGAPVREPTDRRWCEKVTLSLRNTGGSAMRSGTVAFGTHIVGALGIDWVTVESTGTLPSPIAAGASTKKTWTVCVDAWRVPLGMHIETRDVSVQWK
ncbi:hypothetical protein MBT84_22265 [Streptomyces sp. MBT84]|uniref:hypothetical protein n=1 Tax=unclassified Streptomyces TaxID=2593676 RepID=UPI001C6E8688|nr:hypothetical protein [Streptomyces sp. MBT84]MBW8702336.1 hypothetical protein [Streptomyces sp. MBT84]